MSIYCRLIGSLPKPKDLVKVLQDQLDEKPVDPVLLEDLLLRAMRENIARQIKLGYSLVVSGEPDRGSFFHHIFRHLKGLERREGSFVQWLPADLQQYEDVARETFNPAVQHFPYLQCTGLIEDRNPDAIYGELSLYKRALDGWPKERAIWTEPSLGTLANVIDITNSPYKTRQELVDALGNVMRSRYQAVVNEGYILSVDTPDSLMFQTSGIATVEQFLAISTMQIAALNEALDGLSIDRVQAHACYGNYRSTDTRDEPLENLIGPLLDSHASTLFLEGSLSVHRDDYLVLKNLPGKLTFGIGVLDVKYYSVEAVLEVARRIVRMYDELGDRLAGVSPDCGNETMTALGNIPASVAWAKNAVLPQAVEVANAEIARKVAHA